SMRRLEVLRFLPISSELPRVQPATAPDAAPSVSDASPPGNKPLRLKGNLRMKLGFTRAAVRTAAAAHAQVRCGGRDGARRAPRPIARMEQLACIEGVWLHRSGGMLKALR